MGIAWAWGSTTPPLSEIQGLLSGCPYNGLVCVAAIVPLELEVMPHNPVYLLLLPDGSPDIVIVAPEIRRASAYLRHIQRSKGCLIAICTMGVHRSLSEPEEAKDVCSMPRIVLFSLSINLFACGLEGRTLIFLM